MPIFDATAHIFIKPAVLNTAERPVLQKLHELGFGNVRKISMGKCHILRVESPDMDTARQDLEKACKTLLINPVTEYFEVVDILEVP